MFSEGINKQYLTKNGRYLSLIPEYFSVTYEYEAPVVNYPANSWDPEYVYEYNISFPQDQYHEYTASYRTCTDTQGKILLDFSND